jgi:hypothetical protein
MPQLSHIFIYFFIAEFQQVNMAVPQAWGMAARRERRACNTLCRKAMPHNVLLPQFLPHFLKRGRDGPALGTGRPGEMEPY